LQTQAAIWAIAAAPLFFSTDLRYVPEASKAILLNQELLQVRNTLPPFASVS